MNAVAHLGAFRIPITEKLAKQLDVSENDWRVLTDQIFPNAKTVEAIHMALSYCKNRKLDIFKRPVHIVQMWSSEKGRMVETVWPGISEIRTTAARTGEYAGIDDIEFGPMVKRDFVGSPKKGAQDITKAVSFPEYAKVTAYRIISGQKCAFTSKVYWEEIYSSIGRSELPNDMWAKRPRGQLGKCVEADVLRKAFPEEVGSSYTAEEMDGKSIYDNGHVIEQVSTPEPPAPPADIIAETEPEIIEPDELTPEQEHELDAGIIDGEIIDDQTFIDELKLALATAKNTASLRGIWTEFDVEVRFAKDDTKAAICNLLFAEYREMIEDNG